METAVKDAIMGLASFMSTQVMFKSTSESTAPTKKETRPPEVVIDDHNVDDEAVAESIAIIDERVSTTNGLIDREEVTAFLSSLYPAVVIEAVLDKLDSFGALKQ